MTVGLLCLSLLQVNSEEGKRGVEQAVETSLSLGYDVHLTINMELQQQIETILNQAKIKSNADHVIAAVMEKWQVKTATKYDLLSTLNQRG